MYNFVNKQIVSHGKPAETLGRKATGLRVVPTIAGLPLIFSEDGRSLGIAHLPSRQQDPVKNTNVGVLLMHAAHQVPLPLVGPEGERNT